MKAVECDPEEGVAWLGLWIEGMRRGNGDIEKRALQTLASTGFITPGALAYARWILGSLPKNAILLTNGDMDTYPLVTLQQSEGFRTDIAVVNASLLNLNWYAALMTARHRINGGFSPEEIERLQAVDGDGDAANTIARQVVARWESARRKGTLKRPIAIVVGATWQEFVGDIDKYTLAGPYWIYDTGRKHTPFDGATLWKSLRTLKPEEFSGLFVSLRDRSPIRRAYAPPTAGGAVTNDLQHVVEAMQGFRLKSAEELEGWIEKFAVETGARER
jgi:hypothetical protein